MPSVAVVMSVYNGDAYLRESVRSVLNQTFRDFEFIVVDDGSTDRTPEILRAMAGADPRIRLLSNRSRIGLAASLNQALAAASAEFIARQDADDVSLPERLGVQVSFLRAHPEVGVLGSAHYLMNAEGQYVQLVLLPETDTEIRWRLLFENALCHPSIMLRRSLVSAVVPFYDEMLPYAQDYDLWVRLLRHTRAANLAAPLVARRTHSGQVSSTRGKQSGTDDVGRAVSERQIRGLLPGASLTAGGVRTLRAWHGSPPRRFGHEEVRLGRMFVELFNAFLSQEGVDPSAASRIRERWVEPVTHLLSSGGGHACGEPSELPDPWSADGRSLRFPLRIRSRLSRIKQRLAVRFNPPSDRAPILGYRDQLRGESRKRALLAYLVRPFRISEEAARKASHSNVAQTLEIARAFNRLGYEVDVVDWLDRTFTPVRTYEVFFGMHHIFGRLMPLLPDRCRKIYYATGSYWAFENAAEEERLAFLRRRRAVQLALPQRLPPNEWVQRADAMVVKGNRFTLSTYPYQDRPVHVVDNTCLSSGPAEFESKDLESARRHFLWMSGPGLVHKGLDMVLDAFADLPDHHLWVCGMLLADNELDFVRAYRQELFHRANIHPLGWMDVHSEKFERITRRCGFTLLPTCAEGMAGSVLAAMGKGLIPIVSRESGIDTEDFAITLGECTPRAIREAVLQLSCERPEVLRAKAQRAIHLCKTRYSLESFGRTLEEILKQILQSSGPET